MNDKSKELQSKLNSIKTDIENEKKVFIDNCRKAQKKLNFDLSDSQVLRKMSSAIEIILNYSPQSGDCG